MRWRKRVKMAIRACNPSSAIYLIKYWFRA
jgi:hypothetical protein